LCGARPAIGDVSLNLFAFLVAHFVASVEDHSGQSLSQRTFFSKTLIVVPQFVAEFARRAKKRVFSRFFGRPRASPNRPELQALIMLHLKNDAFSSATAVSIAVAIRALISLPMNVGSGSSVGRTLGWRSKEIVMLPS